MPTFEIPADIFTRLSVVDLPKGSSNSFKFRKNISLYFKRMHQIIYRISPPVRPPAYKPPTDKPTPGGTHILGHIRDVRSEWVSFPGRKPAVGCTFFAKNLRMGHNFDII